MKMGKDKSKNRDAKKAGRWPELRYIGIPELKGYYFGHGDHNAGTRFNKTVEKIAEYCRIEISKEIYNLILYGEAPDFPEIPVPSGSKVPPAVLKKYEMDYKRQLDQKEDFEKDMCKAFGIILGQCRELTKEVVKSDKSYKALERADNVTGLLSLLRDLCYGTNKKRYARWIQQAQLRRTVNFSQQTTETIQQFGANFVEQVKTYEDLCGPLVPVKDLIRKVERTRTVGEGDDAVEETYTELVLADEADIQKARDEFIACIFLAGVDRKLYKGAIDEMNNDFMRHGKAYPGDVSSMLTWLLKRRGNTSNNKEDDTTDGVLTSFAQIRSKLKRKCAHCGETGHLAWDCFKLTPAERGEYRKWQSTRGDDESSVGSNGSSRSAASNVSVDSGSSGSASGNERRRGRKSTPPRKGRQSVFGHSNFAFGVSDDKPVFFG